MRHDPLHFSARNALIVSLYTTEQPPGYRENLLELTNSIFDIKGGCGTYAEGAHLSHRDDISNPWSSGANREAVQQQY